MSKRTLLIMSLVVALTAFSLGVTAAYLATRPDLLVGLVALNLAATTTLTLFLHRRTKVLHRRTQVIGAQVEGLVQTQKAQVTAHRRGKRDILSRLADSKGLNRDILTRLAHSEKLHLEIVERLAESEQRYVGTFEAERLRAEDRHLELLSLQEGQRD